MQKHPFVQVRKIYIKYGEVSRQTLAQVDCNGQVCLDMSGGPLNA